MPTSSYAQLYDRHRGPYSLHVVREIDARGKDLPAQSSEHLQGPYSAEEAHEEARILVKQEHVVEVFVFSIREDQFIGAFYKRGAAHRTWREEVEANEHGRLELPDERPEAALLPGRPEPLREVDAPLDGGVPAGALPDRDLPALPAKKPAKPRAKRQRAAKLPGDRFPTVRGRALKLDEGNADPWPRSQAAQVVRALFEGARKQLTVAEIVVMVGAQIRALGVEHPASLVSRLKQAGFLKEI